MIDIPSLLVGAAFGCLILATWSFLRHRRRHK